MNDAPRARRFRASSSTQNTITMGSNPSPVGRHALRWEGGCRPLTLPIEHRMKIGAYDPSPTIIVNELRWKVIKINLVIFNSYACYHGVNRLIRPPPRPPCRVGASPMMDRGMPVGRRVRIAASACCHGLYPPRRRRDASPPV